MAQSESLPPPVRQTGAVGWLRNNLFDGLVNSVVSLLSIVIVVWALYSFLQFVFFGANWALVWENLRLLSVFRYPTELLWRPMACVIMLMGIFGLSAGGIKGDTGFIVRSAFYWILGLILAITVVAFGFWESVRFYWLGACVAPILGFMLGRSVPSAVRALPIMWSLSWFVGVFLLAGFGSPEDHANPMRQVPSDLWGGILLSFFLSVTGIVVCFPLGIALALGRQSKLPIIKWGCTIYIEIIRGAPLVTWLFMASLLLPLALGGVTPAGVVRAQVAIILFAAAYMAENVRGGLQALPKGQPEAAHALGLSPWDTTRIIILPQALRAVIPAIVGLFIGLFKDTSLVTVVGLSDLFATSQKVATQPEASLVTGGVVRELFVFMAVFYWFFCYRMSVASRQLEKQLGLGTR